MGSAAGWRRETTELVLALVLSLRPDATVVLDFIHVLEYVWKAAYSFHAVGSKEAQDWVAERALKILRGEAAGVITGLRQDIKAVSDPKSDGNRANPKSPGVV